MDEYYYVIYFSDGTKQESGTYSGVGAETSCEIAAQQEFDRQQQFLKDIKYHYPTRWDVKKR